MGVRKGVPVSSSKPPPKPTKPPATLGDGQQFMPETVMKDIRLRVQKNLQKEKKT